MKYLLGAHTKVLMETGVPYLAVAVAVTVHTELYTGKQGHAFVINGSALMVLSNCPSVC